MMKQPNTVASMSFRALRKETNWANPNAEFWANVSKDEMGELESRCNNNWTMRATFLQNAWFWWAVSAFASAIWVFAGTGGEIFQHMKDEPMAAKLSMAIFLSVALLVPIAITGILAVAAFGLDGASSLAKYIAPLVQDDEYQEQFEYSSKSCKDAVDYTERVKSSGRKLRVVDLLILNNMAEEQLRKKPAFVEGRNIHNGARISLKQA